MKKDKAKKTEAKGNNHIVNRIFFLTGKTNGKNREKKQI